MNGQPGNFAHWSLPLADWEWFWFGENGGSKDGDRIKLVQPAWNLHAVEEFAGSVRLVFRQQDAIRPGLNLEVCYSFSAGNAFNASYTISNQTGELLDQPEGPASRHRTTVSHKGKRAARTIENILRLGYISPVTRNPQQDAGPGISCRIPVSPRQKRAET